MSGPMRWYRDAGPAEMLVARVAPALTLLLLVYDLLL